jgi:hypothetical protein
MKSGISLKTIHLRPIELRRDKQFRCPQDHSGRKTTSPAFETKDSAIFKKGEVYQAENHGKKEDEM